MPQLVSSRRSSSSQAAWLAVVAAVGVAAEARGQGRIVAESDAPYGLSRPRLNDAGQVGFMRRVGGLAEYVVDTAGTQAVLAREGGPVPGDPAGVIDFYGSSYSTPFTLQNDGVIGFTGYASASVGGRDDQAAFLADAAGVRLVARGGSPAPGGAGVIRSPETPLLDASGGVWYGGYVVETGDDGRETFDLATFRRVGGVGEVVLRGGRVPDGRAEPVTIVGDRITGRDGLRFTTSLCPARAAAPSFSRSPATARINSWPVQVLRCLRATDGSTCSACRALLSRSASRPER